MSDVVGVDIKEFRVYHQVSCTKLLILITCTKGCFTHAISGEFFGHN